MLDLYRDYREERQSRWPEALSRRLATFLFCTDLPEIFVYESSNSDHLSETILDIGKDNTVILYYFWTSEMPSGLYIFKCLFYLFIDLT